MPAPARHLPKSRFADEVLGCARSYVSKLAKQGKLVLDDRGWVDVQASMPLIKAGYGAPERGRAAQRAEQAARQAGTEPPGEDSADPQATKPEPPRDLNAEFRDKKEHYLAENARLDYEERCGTLMKAADVQTVVAGAFTGLRVRLEAWPERLAPQLAPIADETQMRATLAGEVEALLHELAHDLANLLRAAQATTAAPAG
jgi:hypothetical protein